MVGMTTMMMPAKRPPQFEVYCMVPYRPSSACGRVCLGFSVMNTSASSVSFHSASPVSSAAVTRPGRASGAMMRVKVVMALAPSRAAASSRSSGRERKNPVSRNTAKGREVATYSTPRLSRSSHQPTVAHMKELTAFIATHIGTSTTCTGIPSPIAKNEVIGPALGTAVRAST